MTIEYRTLRTHSGCLKTSIGWRRCNTRKNRPITSSLAIACHQQFIVALLYKPIISPGPEWAPFLGGGGTLIPHTLKLISQFRYLVTFSSQGLRARKTPRKSRRFQLEIVYDTDLILRVNGTTITWTQSGGRRNGHIIVRAKHRLCPSTSFSVMTAFALHAIEQSILN